MGNCMKRKKRVVAGFDNVTTHSSYYIQEKKTNDVEYGNNNPITSLQIEWQRQSVSEFENYKMEARLLNSPPISGTMEHIRQKSHPLPTPNLQSQTLTQHHDHQSNKASLLPLPKPHTFDDISYSLEAKTLVPSQASSTMHASILPIPITESQILSSPYLKAFCLDELKKATNNFCEDSLLGEGGFGCVFEGWLDEETLNATRQGYGVAVAIKKLIHSGFQGHKEWLSEVNYLGRLHHPNLVKLIGYCAHGEDRILVYEFMPGGSLEKHLFTRNGAPSLSWVIRIKVAIGAARGLCFLHESNSPVIYRDFKTSNILLDSEFNAKLSDFGLAKSGPTESETHVTTRVMGTQGYCDPRYFATGKLTVKCDVYSFGVVLLELLTGRRAIDETKCEEEKNLVNWVKLHVQDNGKIFRIMDIKLQGQYCKRSAYVAANIALRCVHHEPKYRPPMTYILEILENLPSQKNHHV